MTDDELAALDVPARWVDVFDDRDRAALRLADAMSGESHTIDPDLVDELRRVFTEAERAELVLVAAQANFNNRGGNAAKQVLDDAERQRRE